MILDVDHWRAELRPLLSSVDFPLVSKGFAESLSESGSVPETLRTLLGWGARLAAVTLGDRGSVAAMGDEMIEIPAFEVEARDTTGAGDVFHGAFAWALLAGLPAADALGAASAAAAMNCRSLGAQGGIPGQAELESFLRTGRPQHNRAD